MQITEVSILRIQKGATIEDVSTEQGKAWRDSLNTVASQAGYQRSYWTFQLDNPTTVWWLIDWQNYEASQTFHSSEGDKEFLKRATVFLKPKTPPARFHVDFWSPPSDVFETGPVVEFVGFFYSQETATSWIDERQRKSIETFTKAVGGPHAMAGGLMIEQEVEIPADGFEIEQGKQVPVSPGLTGKGMACLLAWDDPAHHDRFKATTAAYQEGSGELRDAYVGFYWGYGKWQRGPGPAQLTN